MTPACRQDGARPDSPSRSNGLTVAAISVADTLVTRRGGQLGMSEQDLDYADVGPLLQEVRGEAMPQGLHRDIGTARLHGGVYTPWESFLNSASCFLKR